MDDNGIEQQAAVTQVRDQLRGDDALGNEGAATAHIIVGGVIPPQDFDALRTAGAAAIFPPGTVIADSAIRMLELLDGKTDPALTAAE